MRIFDARFDFALSQDTPATKACLIMDEVDGMSAGDRGGVSELIDMIKKSRTPIICICNDSFSQKLKTLKWVPCTLSTT